MNALLPLVIFGIFAVSNAGTMMQKRALQKSHEKSRQEKWIEKFMPKSEDFDQTASLVNLVDKVASTQLTGCASIILYDHFTEDSNDLLLEKLLKSYPIPFIHGQITDSYDARVSQAVRDQKSCVNYILFLNDVMKSKSVIGPQMSDKVIVIARSSQWRVYEFLASEQSQSFMNLLVVAKSEKIISSKIELPYILYTHKLYMDALGSSTHQVLCSWKNGSLTLPSASLFPKKLNNFAGHRFIVSLAHQPPFVIKRNKNENGDIEWDGIEVQIIDMLANLYNFSTDYREAKSTHILGASQSVLTTVASYQSDLGIAGVYATETSVKQVEISTMHSQDCASFISLASTALPRYRAIMGPFHWTVWLCLTAIYLLAIFPLAFSDKHTLSHLVKRPQEMENMFWYVFGTFTNAFTFLGKSSWTKSNKVATRLLIGFYWIFTIIISACYTGSIIAFVTLPVFPAAVDTPQQLIGGGYQIGMLNKGGWENWFRDTNDTITQKLMKDVDLVPDVSDGLKNTTKAFFWPYAFLGSRAELDYIVRTNFTIQNKRSLLHISSECFVPFSVTLIYSKNSLYSRIINVGVSYMVQHGFLGKIRSDVEWQMLRSETGKLLSANTFGTSVKSLNVEDRALTLDDVQGMFLLLGIGFVLGGASLLSEWLGGCVHFCTTRKNSTDSIVSNCRSHGLPTPRQKLDSIQSNNVINSNHSDVELMNPDIQIECIVHRDACTDDMDTYIDRLFDLDAVFGQREEPEEILDDDNVVQT